MPQVTGQRLLVPLSTQWGVCVQASPNLAPPKIGVVTSVPGYEMLAGRGAMTPSL